MLVIIIRGIQDAGLRKVEHTLRDNLKPGYDLKLIDKISTFSSFIEFGGWYAMVFLALAFIAESVEQFLATAGATLFLQLLCGNEDFWHYIAEVLFQHPNREIRYPVKIGPFRFPKDLHHLGAGDDQGHSGWKNPLLMFFCGREVRLKPFLAVVFISTLLVFILSIYWR
jgi:hypothetical protein